MQYLSSNKILCDNFNFTVVYELNDLKRGREHGVEGTYLNFVFKMASSVNVVFTDRRIMDVAFLISLTHKFFFISLPPPHSNLLLVL